MSDTEFNTPSKNGSDDSLADGLISLKLSNKKSSATTPRARTNSKTEGSGRKPSLSPKKSMRFNIATNAINRDFDEILEQENEGVRSDEVASVSSTIINNNNNNEQAKPRTSVSSNKLEFKPANTSNDMESLFLELAKRQRLVSELQLQLTEAERKLKEWEQYCQNVMNGQTGNNNSSNNILNLKNSSTATQGNNNSNGNNHGEHSASEVFNRWTSKLKATTDELLALTHHNSTETEENNTKKNESNQTTNNNKSNNSNQKEPEQHNTGFFQASLGKFTNIIQEFYEDEDDEKERLQHEKELKEKEEGEKTETASKKENNEDDANNSNIFDKLKNKLSEFTVYNEDDEREFDESRKVAKSESMNFELVDHSGVSIDGIHNYSRDLSDSE